MAVDLLDGRTIIVPLAWYPRLLEATAEQRLNWKISDAGNGIHWPDIDEDLSTAGSCVVRAPLRNDANSQVKTQNVFPCQRLPFPARDCLPLPRDCLPLPEIAFPCQRLPSPARDCLPLPEIVFPCQRLPSPARDCLPLPEIAFPLPEIVFPLSERRAEQQGSVLQCRRSLIFAQSFFEFGLCGPITEQRLLVLMIGVGEG